jgi:23S rRNA (adenine2503-C2)-methyltransferase
MCIAQLRQRLRDLGAKPCHEDRLLRGWSQVCSYDKKHSPAETFFPLALRNALPAIEAELNGLARLKSEHAADGHTLVQPVKAHSSFDKLRTNGLESSVRPINSDGVARLLVELHDGQMVESVLLPRGGLCVSTQVGCAVGCVFCMSGRDGLIRQLGSAEIVAQVVLARRRRAVSKVVFMGMGEPAHNLDNVMEAIELLGTQGNIGHKNLVLSTVGDVRVFERLMERCAAAFFPPPCRGRTKVGVEALSNARTSTPIPTFPLHGGRSFGSNAQSAQSETVKPALALSLHSTDAALRAKLLPHAPQIAIEELVERGETYARATGYPVQYQWTLIEGVNDSDAELDRISQLLSGKYAVMNFIPFNEVDGLDYRRPSAERIASMVQTLKRKGILATIRDSAGQEIEGACGQLRARAMKAVAIA